MTKYTVQKANDYIKKNMTQVVQDFRPTYHVAGEIGWINDPNGFSFFNGEYHLFYQFYPYESEWGPIHWGHVKSKDLIKWERLPVALAPDSNYDLDGCFSGSAIEFDGKHILMYTGHVNPDPKNPEKIRQVQCIAVGNGIHYSKLESNPVISSEDLPDGASVMDFRDPKIWKNGDYFYCVIGSLHKDNSGQILLYKSSDLENWTFVGVVKRSENKLGKMWECPDLFHLDGEDILIVSPQFLEQDEERFENIHSCIYMIGKFNYQTAEFKENIIDEIDAGFDFYAPQTLVDDRGRRILIAWMQMWDRNIPTEQLGHKWAGMMTLPRVLSIKEGKLYQQPIEEIKKYRKNQYNFNDVINGSVSVKESNSRQMEIHLKCRPLKASSFGIKVRKGSQEETVISYDLQSETLSFDRSKSGIEINDSPTEKESRGIRTTKVSLNQGQLDLRIFLDSASVEIFINGGSKTMTSTIYPSLTSNGIELFSDGEVEFEFTKWDICVENQ